MKGVFQYGFAALFCMVTLSAVCVGTAHGQITSTIMRRMEETRKSLNSVKADITMSKYDAALQTSDGLFVGTTKYLPEQTITAP